MEFLSPQSFMSYLIGQHCFWREFLVPILLELEFVLILVSWFLPFDEPQMVLTLPPTGLNRTLPHNYAAIVVNGLW